MNAKPRWQEELAALLREQGHGDADVTRIMARVETYESQLQLDSVMSSIGDGSLDLAAIVREALEDQSSQSKA